MTGDIFKFWESLPPGEHHVHPEDRPVLERTTHGFQLDCLVGSFWGRLRTTPVVLLFRSPGFAEFDLEHAKSDAARRNYALQRSGNSDLPTEKEHQSFYGWALPKLHLFDLSYEGWIQPAAWWVRRSAFPRRSPTA